MYGLYKFTEYYKNILLKDETLNCLWSSCSLLPSIDNLLQTFIVVNTNPLSTFASVVPFSFCKQNRTIQTCSLLHSSETTTNGIPPLTLFLFHTFQLTHQNHTLLLHSNCTFWHSLKHPYLFQWFLMQVEMTPFHRYKSQ